MDRDKLRLFIKGGIPCTYYLKPAPNYSAHNNTGYCCPYSDCGSGTHGTGSDGAVKYYPNTNTWHCFSCNRGGDVIDAYSAATGSDHNEAITYLAAQMGIDTSRPVKTSTERAERPQSDEKQIIDKLPDKDMKPAEIVNQRDFTAYYKTCSDRLNDPAAISYLKARGISIETAQRFNIGYDTEADPAAAPGAMAGEYKAHPTPRIIAPCTNDFYIARSIDPNTPAAFKAPNPKGTHTQLFNAAALYSAQVVFICEGIFDALSFEEAGQAAIATNGKGNGKLILKQLEERPTTASLVIVPDDDKDPKTAAKTMRQAEELNNQLQAMGIKSIVYNMAAEYKAAIEEGKDIKDANDVLTADRMSFEQSIEAAIYELQRDDLTDFLEKITTETYKPYCTGLNFFDDLLGGGVIPQSLLLLLAAPAAGKTTLAQQLAETMAKERKPVIYFNFEMSREQMLAKAISAKYYKGNGGDKSATEILQGYSWTPAERKQIERVIEEYRRENYPYIKYNPAGTSADVDDMLTYLAATGEAAKAKGEPAPAAVVDYLHLLTSRRGLEPQELIKQAVTGLKEYAIKYNTFAIAITAINRESMKKGQLTIDSGRDSSNLEYTADYQISLNYFDVDQKNVDPQGIDEMSKLQQEPNRKMILRMLKNRWGIQGKSQIVMFDARHNLFNGTCSDYMPAGFTAYNNAPAFDSKPIKII